MQRVYTKARTSYGRVYPAQETNYQVDIVKGKSIVVQCDRTQKTNSFNVGDMAEYDSYNLSYYGPIIAITDKRVTIICRHDVKRYNAGEKVKKHCLDLYTFCFRNYNFELNRVSKENFETSLVI